ncbi:hypothetical protein ACMBCM_05220 [Spiroplasma sp. K1]
MASDSSSSFFFYWPGIAKVVLGKSNGRYHIYIYIYIYIYI